MSATGIAHEIEIEINPVSDKLRRAKPADVKNLGFGKYCADHMFTMTWRAGEGWSGYKIEPYAPLELDPATLALHYGQIIFDGFKAFITKSGEASLFRPRKYIERMNNSASRLDMPKIDVETIMTALNKLLTLDREWIPNHPNTALYIRPFMFASEAHLGVKTSSEYRFVMFSGPVGAYYPEGFNPVAIRVSDTYTRACVGGLGAAKTPANYAASLLAAREAKEAGYSQVLWLDAAERKYIEEVGAMNIFFKINGEIATPQLSGSILPGVTRDSVLEMLRSSGARVSERRISIGEVVDALKSGAMEEIFGTGTAAIIAPVGVLEYKGEVLKVSDGKTGPLAKKLFDEITGIQYGAAEDKFGWNCAIHA